MNQNLTSKIQKKTLLFCLWMLSTIAFAQKNIVSGVITDENGEPLAGVTVTQKGSQNGTYSDFDGNYSIRILPKGQDILIFSYIGFQTQQVPVKKGATVSIKLKQDAESLEEVVVIGYGTQKKSDVSGAISSISAEDLEDNVFTSVGQTLQGRASGISVTEGSGEPGGGLDINIRGLNSLSGNGQPLYILDGIPLSLDAQADDDSTFTSTNPLSTLNPDDIESIEVLKDASSTAIYGSRAANGVIIINTKSATVGKPKIKGRIRTSISTPKAFELLNAIQFNTVINDVALLDNPARTFEQLVASENTRVVPDVNINGEGTDFIGALLRTSYMKDYALSISGGNKTFSQLLSLSFSDQEGVVIESKFNRANLRYNSTYNITDKWKFNSNVQINYSRNRRVVNSTRTGTTGVIFNAFRINPNRTVFSEDGEFFDEDEDGSFVANPISNAINDETVLQNKDLIGGFTNTYKFDKSLIWTTRIGLQHRISNNTSFANKRSARGRRDDGRLFVSNALRTNFSVESFLNYNKTFDKKHRVTGLLGVAYEDNTTFSDRNTYIDFTFDDLGPNASQLANNVTSFSSNKSNFTLQSGFSRLGYTYDNKYIVTFNIRADGTSKFINGQPWGFFPSAALAWVASKEGFLKNVTPLSNLKFRASYGITGNQSGVGPLQTQAAFDIDRVGLSDSELHTATFPSGVANSELTWETSRSLNTGVDFSLFKNRVYGSVDYYVRTTEDLLNNLQIPNQTGFGRIALNAGDLRSSGVEVELGGTVVNTRKFKWKTRANWSTNKTTLEEYGGLDFTNGPNIATNFFNEEVSRTFIGDQIGNFWGYKITGLVQLDDVEIVGNTYQVKTDGEGNPVVITGGNNRPGSWTIEDLNGDGQITADDKQVLGNPNPDFFFGWNNTFNIGKFTINTFINGQFGNEILNVNKGFTGVGWGARGASNSTVEWFNKRWTPDNQHNNPNFPSSQSFIALDAPTSVYVEDGSFVRLRNVSVRYPIKLKKHNFKANVTLAATNLYTWTNYSGADPEVNTNRGNAFSRGVDYAAYPRPKTYSLTLDFNF